MSGRESAPPEVITAVDDWNARYSVGTPVRYWPGAKTGPGRESTTRTPAWVIHGGHSALVSVEGRSGGIILSHIEVITEDELLRSQADEAADALMRDLAGGDR